MTPDSVCRRTHCISEGYMWCGMPMLSISNGVVSGVLGYSITGTCSSLNTPDKDNTSNAIMARVFEYLCERCIIDLSQTSLRKGMYIWKFWSAFLAGAFGIQWCVHA